MFVVFEMINEMEWENTNGQMEHVTRDSFELVIVMGKVNIDLQVKKKSDDWADCTTFLQSCAHVCFVFAS